MLRNLRVFTVAFSDVCIFHKGAFVRPRAGSVKITTPRRQLCEAIERNIFHSSNGSTLWSRSVQIIVCIGSTCQERSNNGSRDWREE